MMGLKGIIEAIKKKKAAAADPGDLNVLRNWYRERYESTIIQRNLLFIIAAASMLIIVFSMFVIRYVRSTRSIEPFVIEIERKTGIPTVVDPVTVAAYSADIAIKRHYIWRYIKAREEYLSTMYMYNYTTLVRVLSTSGVYFSDYRPKFSMSNPSSPYNLYGQHSTREVVLKSIIFPNDNTAQVRLSMDVSGMISMRMNKIVFMEFDFQNIEMNDEERLINPLGFRVTLYRIEDEKI